MDSRSEKLHMHKVGHDRVIHEHAAHVYTHVCTAYTYAKRNIRPGCSSPPPPPPPPRSVSEPGVTDSVINTIQLH